MDYIKTPTWVPTFYMAQGALVVLWIEGSSLAGIGFGIGLACYLLFRRRFIQPV